MAVAEDRHAPCFEDTPWPRLPSESFILARIFRRAFFPSTRSRHESDCQATCNLLFHMQQKVVMKSRQTGYSSAGQHLDVRGSGHLRQAGHGHDVATDDDNKAGTRREPQFVHPHTEAARTTAQGGIIGKRHGRLRNANRQFPEAVLVEQFDAALRGAVKVHTVGPVELRGQRFDLLLDRRFQADT